MMVNRFSTIFGGIPPVVKNLLIINVLLLFATYVLGNMGIDLTKMLGLYFPASDNFQPYQIVTHMFMHGGFTHLFFNMFALWMFGKVLESVWGSKRFLIYYFVTGFGAVALHLLVQWIQYIPFHNAADLFLANPSPEGFSSFLGEYYPALKAPNFDFISAWMSEPGDLRMMTQATEFVNEALSERVNVPTVGASGAVFGVLLAFGMLFPNTQLMLLFPPIPIKAKYFVIGYGLIELYSGVLNQPGDNVAHFAHLGGMLFGFLLIKYWRTNRRNFY